MLKYSIILTAIVITILAVNLEAQEKNASISGWVKDSLSGEVLVGSNIIVYKDTVIASTPPLRGAVTNEYGFYAIANLSPSVYFIIFRHLGYKTTVEKIEFSADRLAINLSPVLLREDVELEEVVVKGKKEFEEPVSTIDLSPEILSQLPSMSGEVDIFKSLEMLPGVKAVNEFSKGLYIRGGSPDQTLTLVDGVIVYNPTHLGNFASTFNSNALQNVKLIKGAFPAEYGGRLSSVIDIKLRSGTREKEKRTLGIGLISSNFSMEGPFTSNSTYMISGRKMYYDFIQEKMSNSSIPRYNFYDFSTKISYNISQNNIVSVSGIFGKDNLYNPAQAKDIKYDIGWQNSTASVNWLKINSESLLINTMISYIDYRFKSLLQSADNTNNSSNYFSSSKLKDFIIRSNVESNFYENHTIKSGFELTLHNYNLLYSETYDKLIEEDPNALYDIFATEAALFLQDEWNLLPQLKTNIGGRFYYFKTKKYLRFEPRISLTYKPEENISITLAYASANQFLHLIVKNDISLPTDLWYPSSENLEPSQSSQYVLGLSTQLLNNQYTFSIEAYYKEMKNILEFSNSTPIQKDELIEDKLSVGQGEAYGIEFFLNKNLGDFTGWIGYTLSWTRKQFDNINAGRIFFPRYDRRHDLSAVFLYKFNKSVSMSMTWTFATGQGFTMPTGQYQFYGDLIDAGSKVQFDYTERNAYRLEDYHKMDMNITYAFTLFDLSAKAFLNIYNLYNRSNPFAYYITFDKHGNNVPTINKLTLFPFIPSIGFSIDF